jgi:hypothetical protein
MILVYTEQQNGIFKKAAYEAISYAANIAQSTGAQVCAVVLGEASGLETLGQLWGTAGSACKRCPSQQIRGQSMC